MNVAIFIRVLFMSGVTTHIIDLTKQLNKRGHKVYIFTAGAQYRDNEANLLLVDSLIAAGGEMVEIPFPRNTKRKFIYIIKMFLSLPVVWKKLKTFKIDIIHVHTPVLSFIPVLLNRKFVKTIHVKGLSLAFLDRKATHEITISSETYHESREKYNYSDEQVSIIFNGVDKSFANLMNNQEKLEFKSKIGLSHEKFIIGIVGSIQKRKGHDILIEAIFKLDSNIKSKIELIILGEGNESEEKWLSELIFKYNLQSIVKKFTFQNPKPFYDIMDVFVLPSRLEGFPLVVIEAFLSNCCVVRSNVEGANDQIKNGFNGFLFGNENVDELTNILEEVLTNETLRKKVALNGRENALNKFTSDIMTDKTIIVYNNVMNLNK